VLNDIEFLRDLWPDKNAFTQAMALRLALGGIGGFYGAETASDLFDYAMEYLVGKKDWMIKKKETIDAWRKLSKEKTGIDIPQILLRGLPTIVGLEGSIVFGSGELFDIALLPMLGTAKWMVQQQIQGGVDQYEAWRRVMPQTVKHILGYSTKDIFGKEKLTIEDAIRAVPELKESVLKQIQNLPPEMSEWEKILYAIGFSTTTPTEYYNTLEAIRRSVSGVRREKAVIHREIARAVREGRQKDVDKIIKDAISKGYILSEEAVERQIESFEYPRSVSP